MKKYMYLFLFLLVSHLQPAVAQENEAMMPVHMELLEIGKLATDRPSTLNVWFPQGKCAEQKEKQLCLADAAITNKVLVFSHGAMGSAIEYSWIGEKLAAAGFVVVGVNHFGESSIYGKDSRNPRSTALIWQRPQDISALLDRLATRSIFQNKVSWSNVVAIGHSSGGQTAAMLAGATFDLQRLIDYCNSEQSKDDRSCNYGRNRASAPKAFREQFSASQQDHRVKMMVMLDPALGSAVQAESLRGLKIPTLVVGAQNSDFLPWTQHGLRYATEIPGAKIYLLTGQEGHFIFLNTCGRQIRVMGVPLCEDRQGADREATHEALADAMIEFIRSQEGAFSGPSTDTIPARKYTTSSPIAQILMYTPRWVFGILAALVILGLWQVRTRQVSLPVALILPIYMLVDSFTGVFGYVGLNLLALSCWLLAAVSITSLSLTLMDKNIAKFDLSNRKLEIRGSWLPLFIILGIFFTRFALGVATGMDLKVIQHPYFPVTTALVLGGWSGFFLARGVIFWRAKELASGRI